MMQRNVLTRPAAKPLVLAIALLATQHAAASQGADGHVVYRARQVDDDG